MKPLTEVDLSTLMTLLEDYPLLLSHGQRKMRATQIWQWLYKHGAQEWGSMSNLPQKLRAFLTQRYTLRGAHFTQEHQAPDGVIKWVTNVGNSSKNHTVETVYIPEKTEKAFRGTLCISSQVGCVLDCGFCYTGTQDFIHNLSTSAMVEQVLLAKDALDDWDRSPLSQRLITNIVFMGMGEPLYNTDNVLQTASLLSADDGLCYGRRRITVSTAGIVPEIPKLSQAQSVSLTVSLHAADNDTRSLLMPINKRYPIEPLMEVCQDYTKTTSRPITFAYVLLDGFNDTIAHADALVSLVANMDAKINLIPFNPWPGTKYRASGEEQIKTFANVLLNNKIVSTIRRSRGTEIMAACGQLKSPSRRPVRKAA